MIDFDQAFGTENEIKGVDYDINESLYDKKRERIYFSGLGIKYLQIKSKEIFTLVDECKNDVTSSMVMSTDLNKLFFIQDKFIYYYCFEENMLH